MGGRGGGEVKADWHRDAELGTGRDTDSQAQAQRQLGTVTHDMKGDRHAQCCGGWGECEVVPL